MHIFTTTQSNGFGWNKKEENIIFIILFDQNKDALLHTNYFCHLELMEEQLEDAVIH